MVIQSLHLKSFRSFVDVDLPLESPRVFLSGVNGVGKSTIRESIRYILLGRCQGLDGKGAGSERLVPSLNGSTGVSASLSINGIGTIERTWSPAGSSLRVQGFTGNTGSQQSALLEKLETTEAFLAACVDSRLFLNLGHADAKALVLALLNVRIRLGEADDAPVMTLTELDEAYAQAFEDRKAAKIKVKGFFVPQKPAETSAPKVADVDARLAVIRKELEVLIGQTGQVSGQRAQLERRQAALLHAQVELPTPEAWQALQDRIADLEERLGLMDDVSEAMPTLEETPEPEVGDPQRIPFLRNRIEALKAHRPKEGCVIDAEVGCPVGRQAFTARAKALDAELSTLQAGPESPALHAVVPPDPKVETQYQLAELQRTKERCERNAADEAKRVKDLTDVQAELAALADTTEQEAAVTDLRQRIQKGEGIRTAAGAYWKALEAYEQAAETQRALQAEVSRLEELCAVLGPSGVRVQALGNAMGAFEAAVNSFTGPFGWTVKFLLDPWGVQVNERAVETYSWSEQYRIGIAIQLAVAALSGLKFAVVDELDLLDQKNRDLMGRLLYAAPLDQILILATREHGQALPSGVKGMVSYRLDRQEGRTLVVERA